MSLVDNGTKSISVARLRIPATSANLGPGFDSLGLAMTLYLEIEAELATEFHIEAVGRDSAVCGALSHNLILTTYMEVLGAVGVAAPALRLRIRNGIPLGMGCGSSAAALVGGVLLASHFGGLGWSAQQVLHEAATREGHPDNVAACVLGGVTVAAATGTETVAVSLGQKLPWRLLLALPHAGLSTRDSRSMLPAIYTRADTVANVQASSLLVAACATGRAELLQSAMVDRLHEPYREMVCPLFARLRTMRGWPGVFGVVLSGAGPAVLLVVDEKFARSAVETMAGPLLMELLDLHIAEGAVSS